MQAAPRSLCIVQATPERIQRLFPMKSGFTKPVLARTACWHWSERRALAIFVAVACYVGQNQALDLDALTGGLWVHLDSAWEHYGEGNSSTQVAYARIARFAPDGEFSWIACMLLRNDKKHWTTISAGDGQVILWVDVV